MRERIERRRRPRSRPQGASGRSGRRARGREASEEGRLTAVDAAERPGSRRPRGRIGEELRQRGDGLAIANPPRGERRTRSRGGIGLGEQAPHRGVGCPPDLRREDEVLCLDPLRGLGGRGAPSESEGTREQRREPDQGSQRAPLQVVRRRPAKVADEPS